MTMTEKEFTEILRKNREAIQKSLSTFMSLYRRLQAIPEIDALHFHAVILLTGYIRYALGISDWYMKVVPPNEMSDSNYLELKDGDITLIALFDMAYAESIEQIKETVRQYLDEYGVPFLPIPDIIDSLKIHN